MNGNEDDLTSFARLVEALRPWHSQLVIIGGWAHRLHRLLPGAKTPLYSPIRTIDADLAFDTNAELRGNIGLTLVGAGFREELATEHHPPVSWHRLGVEGGFYAEFITPLHGSGIRRDGKDDATVSRAGVTAQKLRHVDLLLTTPVSIDLDSDSEIPMRTTASVRVAHPACFIAQKLLIAHNRALGKRAQDVLYVHDTIELFATSLGASRDYWQNVVRVGLHPNVLSGLQDAVDKQYGRVTDAVRQAARIPSDRRLDPERVRLVCETGLRRIFGVDSLA